MQRKDSLMVIGAAIGDVTVMPAPKNLPSAGSTPMERIRLSTGGDALNEATVAARLGCKTALVTLLGRDDMAAIIRSHCDREGVRLLGPEVPEMDTGLNVVLVDETGERRFLTNANSTLRRLSLAHILPVLETEEYAAARAVCLASLFVSPALTLTDTEALFRRVKADGKLLCADTTRPKHGETAADAAGALKHLDWFFPNLEEALRLTKADSPCAAAESAAERGRAPRRPQARRRGLPARQPGDGFRRGFPFVHPFPRRSRGARRSLRRRHRRGRHLRRVVPVRAAGGRAAGALRRLRQRRRLSVRRAARRDLGRARPRRNRAPKRRGSRAAVSERPAKTRLPRNCTAEFSE